MLINLLDDILVPSINDAVSQVKVLFIGGQPGPTQGADDNVMLFLQNKYGVPNVEYKQASAAVTADADRKNLLVISSTPGSGDIRGKWNNSKIPVINWEEAVMKSTAGDFEFSDSTSKPDTTDINVIDEDHPIMIQTGLANGLQVIGSLSERNCVNGTIPAGVNVLAEQNGVATCKMVTVAEKGTADFNGNPFPERRAMFPMTNNSFDDLNATGLALFDAYLDWLTYSSEY